MRSNSRLVRNTCLVIADGAGRRYPYSPITWEKRGRDLNRESRWFCSFADIKGRLSPLKIEGLRISLSGAVGATAKERATVHRRSHLSTSLPSSFSSFNNLSLLAASAFGLVSGEPSLPFLPFSLFFFFSFSFLFFLGKGGGARANTTFFRSGCGRNTRLFSLSPSFPLSLSSPFFSTFFSRRLLASGVQIIRRLLLPLLPPGLDVAGNVSRDYIRVITIVIIIIIIIYGVFGLFFSGKHYSVSFSLK